MIYSETYIWVVAIRSVVAEAVGHAPPQVKVIVRSHTARPCATLRTPASTGQRRGPILPTYM